MTVVHKPTPVQWVPVPAPAPAPWQFFQLMSEYYRMCHLCVSKDIIHKKNIKDLEGQIKELKERNRQQKILINKLKYQDSESSVANTLVKMRSM